jgi:peptidoglycan/xylan/chitin deacetylase (PgdA/CDA1 family)
MRALAIQCAICFALVALVASMGPSSPLATHSASASEPWVVDFGGGADPLADPPAAATTPTTSPALWASDLIPLVLAAAPTAPVKDAVPAPPAAAPASTPVSTDPCAPTRPLIAPVLIKSGPKDRPRVALTIDDTFAASGAKNVAAVLDIAKAKGAKLTFFPTGGAFDDHEKAGLAGVWRRVVAEGHEIGNHTYSHWNLLKLGEKDIQDELDSTQGRLDQVLGFHYEMHLMRPPGGNGGYPDSRGDPNGTRVRCVVQRLGYSMAMWSIDSNGTQGFSDYLYRLQAPGVVNNGSIVLLHFTTFNVNNISVLIDNLTKRGFELVTVSQLFA